MRTIKMPFCEIAEGVYEIDEFDLVSVFVIVGSERALVIDTGTGAGDLRHFIETKITDKPYDVVISHAHGDHNGGAGFFDKVYVHPLDMNWDIPGVTPTLEFRRDYARTITRREGKHYDYDVEKDIVEWEKTPEKLPMEDGQVFDLGDRKVTAYHCPGHTAGEMVFIDDKSRILFLADACNCNLLLAHGFGKDARDEAEKAKAGLERLLSMKEKWDCFYNAHHDFRGLGQTLYPSAIQDAINCYESLLSGTAEFHKEADPLFLDNPPKVFAQSGVVKISYMDGDISKAFPNE